MAVEGRPHSLSRNPTLVVGFRQVRDGSQPTPTVSTLSSPAKISMLVTSDLCESSVRASSIAPWIVVAAKGLAKAASVSSVRSLRRRNKAR